MITLFVLVELAVSLATLFAVAAMERDRRARESDVLRGEAELARAIADLREQIDGVLRLREELLAAGSIQRATALPEPPDEVRRSLFLERREPAASVRPGRGSPPLRSRPPTIPPPSMSIPRVFENLDAVDDDERQTNVDWTGLRRARSTRPEPYDRLESERPTAIGPPTMSRDANGGL